MTVRVVHQPAAHICEEHDFVRVSTCSDPNDDTITLATIQRIVDKPRFVDKPEEDSAAQTKRYVKTLVLEHPMSVDAAIGFAECYAERKKIPVIFAEAD